MTIPDEDSPRQGSTLRRSTVASAATTLVLLIAAMMRSSAQAPDRPARWEGALTEVLTEDFARQETPWADGVWTSTFNVRARWREGHRIPVSDPTGRVVGNIVVLADEGSTWDAAASGTATARRRRETTTLTGSGSGGAVLQAGWLYRSLVADDPL